MKRLSFCIVISLWMIGTLVGCGNSSSSAPTLTPADIVAADKSALAIGYGPGDNAASVQHNLVLPPSGTNGSDISWSSRNPDIISSSGGVTVPTDNDANVTMTATIHKGAASDTKDFALAVKALLLSSWVNVNAISPGNGAIEVDPGIVVRIPFGGRSTKARSAAPSSFMCAVGSIAFRDIAYHIWFVISRGGAERAAGVFDVPGEMFQGSGRAWASRYGSRLRPSRARAPAPHVRDRYTLLGVSIHLEGKARLDHQRGAKGFNSRWLELATQDRPSALAVFTVIALLSLAVFDVNARPRTTEGTSLSDTSSHAASIETSESARGEQRDWPVYGGSRASDHYSDLAQINRSNVKQLAVAWTFDTEETGGLQTSPIELDGVLYGITPSQKVFALDAATGKQLWKFDSGIKGTQPNRGLAYWSDGKDKRILVGVMNFLYALDAKTGTPIASFGKNGRIDLREDLGRDPSAQSIYLTSPGIVYKDLIIVGGREPETLPAPPGDIRAYDARNGKLRWSFHTIPHPGEFGYDTWPKDAWKASGAANNWAGMSLDSKRGFLYVPTGSAAMDFYGADRVGDDLFADCLLALNAETGERIWHFQEVRHDIWDRDLPAPPVLLTVKHEGKEVDAVAQTTKQGFVYLFDRTNGRPLFPIEYKKYPASDVPAEMAAAEQPLPTKPAPFARQRLTEDLLSTRTPEVHQWALEQFRKFRSDGQFLPFTVDKDTVVFPGFDGGAEWGGPALDRQTGILYVNANDVAWTGALTENTGEHNAQAIYLNQCGVCHGEQRKGSPPAIPSLVGVGDRITAQQIAATIKNGKGRMPGFPNLTDEQMFALVDYLASGVNKEVASVGPPEPAMKYRFTGYKKFLDPEGYPAAAPPWGTLSAIDLNTGEYVWKIPLGEYPELAVKGLNKTGTENYGGPTVTAGGLVFIGATNFDKKFRAFDKATGELLWETTLPFSGNATPITYELNGKQFVVIAAGGGKDPKSASGGVYVGFALK